MGTSGSKVGSWVRASQSLPPYGITDLHGRMRGACRAQGRRSPVVMRHNGVSVFPGVARQHSKKTCVKQCRKKMVLTSAHYRGSMRFIHDCPVAAPHTNKTI